MFALCPPCLVLHLAGSQVHMHTHAWPCPRAQGAVGPTAVLLPPRPPHPWRHWAFSQALWEKAPQLSL